MQNNLGFCRTLSMPFSDTVSRVTQALGKEGFSVAGDVDLQSMFLQTLGMDDGPALHLTVFDPQIARSMLEIGTDLGLLMLLHVTVFARANGESTVCITDPIQALAPVTTPAIKPISDELNRRLWRVFLDVVVFDPNQYVLA